MGEEAIDEYWDKVEVMGYELAPYNELFAGGKNRKLDNIDLEFSKPESADFEFGGGGNASGLSATDYDLADGVADVETAVNDFELGVSEAGELAQDVLADGGSGGPASVAESLEADDLLAEILAQDEDDDATNLNFGNDKTTNINFDQDEPVIIDRYEDDDGEADAIETLDLDQVLDDDDCARDEPLAPDQFDYSGIDLDEDEALDLDRIGDIAEDHDDDEAEVMQFTMADEIEIERIVAAEDEDLAMATPADSAAQDSTSASSDGRILFFPDSPASRDAANSEFESEVRMTLQALRDQLQFMTERLFRQERETSDLRRTVSELSEQATAAEPKRNKKTS
jgi:hypothetical protein